MPSSRALQGTRAATHCPTPSYIRFSPTAYFSLCVCMPPNGARYGAFSPSINFSKGNGIRRDAGTVPLRLDQVLESLHLILDCTLHLTSALAPSSRVEATEGSWECQAAEWENQLGENHCPLLGPVTAHPCHGLTSHQKKLCISMAFQVHLDTGSPEGPDKVLKDKEWSHTPPSIIPSLILSTTHLTVLPNHFYFSPNLSHSTRIL